MNAPPMRWLFRALVLLGFVLLVGLTLAFLLQFSIFPSLLFVGQITIDLSAVVFYAAVAMAVMGLMLILVSWFWHRRHIQSLAGQQRSHEVEHRQFIHRLDHELKNPLAILQINLASLEQQSADVSETREFQSAEQQLARLGHLVQDLRKLAEIETRALEMEQVNLAELLPEVIAIIQTRSGQNARAISLILQQVPWTPPPVLGDRDLLALAFYNLLDNAVKFTRPNDTIEVHVHEGDGAVIVDIADTGIGIPEAELSLIFQELYRGENSREIEGSGLGLTLAQRIIQRHGGTLSVRSRIGKGTICTVRLTHS